MTSSFTVNKDLEQPGNGDYVDRWNIPLNGDMGVLDYALGYTITFNATAGSQTLGTYDHTTKALDTYSYIPLIINITGALSADVVYTIPSGVGGQWIVNNNTTGAHTVTFASGGGGTNQIVSQGYQSLIAANGTDIWLITSGNTTPTGGGTNKVFFLNGQTITADYTIPTGQNAGTFGPVTINTGITVTIPSGSYWTVV